MAAVTLGVSVYPDLRPLQEIGSYLARAAAHGFTRVFSSMFSVAGTKDEVLALFARLNAAAHAHGMQVALDVNPACMERMGTTPADLGAFAAIGTDILRMDGAYGANDNATMLANPHNIKIEYNASSLDPAAVEELAARGCDRTRILACHNFYPQRYTGMRWDRFCDVTARLATLGIRVGAFISSKARGTHGVWDATCGLPTVERMRDYPADLQARLLAAAGATDILFGNAYATDAELASVADAVNTVRPHYTDPKLRALVDELASYGAATLGPQHKLRVEPLYDLTDVEREILFDFYPHADMGDSSEWMWRSRLPRMAYQSRSIAPRRYDGAEFPVGSVLMVNDRYKHYAGELQVALAPIANDGTRNLVARIDAQEMDQFDLIHDMDVLIFMPARS